MLSVAFVRSRSIAKVGRPGGQNMLDYLENDRCLKSPVKYSSKNEEKNLSSE